MEPRPAFCNGLLGPHRPDAAAVPFFLYPPNAFSMWTGCDRSQHLGKHSAALLLVTALETQPWRTADMRAACVFVIPALIDWMANGKCATASDDDHLENLTRTVSPHLHRGRHIFLAADFSQVRRFGTLTASACLKSALPGIRQAHFRHEPPCHIGLGYVTDFDLVHRSAPWNRMRSAPRASKLAESAHDAPAHSDEQAACARYWNVPMPDEFYKPIMPGETRKWEWTTGDMPTGWAKKVKVKAVDIVLGIEDEEEE